MARRRARCIRIMACRSPSLFPRRLSMGVGRGGSGQVPVISRAMCCTNRLRRLVGHTISAPGFRLFGPTTAVDLAADEQSPSGQVDQACASFPLPRHSCRSCWTSHLRSFAALAAISRASSHVRNLAHGLCCESSRSTGHYPEYPAMVPSQISCALGNSARASLCAMQAGRWPDKDRPNPRASRKTPT